MKVKVAVEAVVLMRQVEPVAVQLEADLKIIWEGRAITILPPAGIVCLGVSEIM